MTRAALVWGGAAAAILGLGAVALAVIVATSATPAAHVQRYLDALARDDLAAAARLAGIEPPSAMPLGDEGEAGIRRIISANDRGDGTVAVVAEYGGENGGETDAARVTFVLEPAPAALGIVPRWAFTTPPVAELEISADLHDRVDITNQPVVAEEAGGTVVVRVFVPARVTVRLDDPLLRAEPVTTRVALADNEPITLAVSPSATFERRVQREVERLLAACTEQEVLLPAGCPFGVEITDRVTVAPQWELIVAPEIALTAGERPGVWSVRGAGMVRLVVTVQRLLDGSVKVRDEEVAVTVRGEVVIEPEGPVLTLYPPGG